jgi:hypothetical protein
MSEVETKWPKQDSHNMSEGETKWPKQVVSPLDILWLSCLGHLVFPLRHIVALLVRPLGFPSDIFWLSCLGHLVSPSDIL